MASFATHFDDEEGINLEDEDEDTSDEEDDEEMRVAEESKFQDAEEQQETMILGEENEDHGHQSLMEAQQHPFALHTESELSTQMMPLSQPPRTDDDDEVEDEEDSDEDGEIPLATPYPWAQDDYELTLHHDPKPRQAVGTGMVYLKRLILDESESKHEESSLLSDPAKGILTELLKQTSKSQKLPGDDEDSSDEEESSDDEDDDDDDDEETKTQRRQLPGPRLWNNQSKSYKEGLFHHILQIVDEVHPINVTTRHIIRHCALEINPAEPPGLFDAKEVICCALHFLSSEWTSPDTSQLPTLPLIRSNTAPGNARDLEKRSYEKVGDWHVDELPLRELERLFFSTATTESTKQQQQPHLLFLSRVRFCPRNPTHAGDKETSLLLKGTIPARMTGKKQLGPATKKAKTESSASATTPVVPRRVQQGKQLPPGAM